MTEGAASTARGLAQNAAMVGEIVASSDEGQGQGG